MRECLQGPSGKRNIEPMTSREDLRRLLLDLAHDLGDGRHMAIVGEGNVSGKLDARHFLIKASGTRMSTLQPQELVGVDARPLLAALAGGEDLTDQEIERLLLEARTDPDALKPSVESLFHAWLLTLPGIRIIGHVHAIAVNQVLCSPRKRDFAVRRVIPDQVVYCGVESVLVPYVDPGFTLARRIAGEVETFRKRTGVLPKTILLENHGVIALGTQHTEVIAALAMAEKAARIFVGAAALGGPVFMDESEVHRIAGRTDEHYRQRMLQRHQPRSDHADPAS